jgi:hypothetical protein
MLGDDVISEAIREGRDCQGRVGANRARQHRPIGNVEAGIIKHLAVRINHPFLLPQGHRAATAWVGSDDLVKIPHSIGFSGNALSPSHSS